MELLSSSNNSLLVEDIPSSGNIEDESILLISAGGTKVNDGIIEMEVGQQPSMGLMGDTACVLISVHALEDIVNSTHLQVNDLSVDRNTCDNLVIATLYSSILKSCENIEKPLSDSIPLGFESVLKPLQSEGFETIIKQMDFAYPILYSDETITYSRLHHHMEQSMCKGRGKTLIKRSCNSQGVST